MNWPIEHRPYAPPGEAWIMTQRWHDLLFAHWPVPVGTLRPLVPASLPIDTFEGQEWLGIVPFHMTGVRYRWMPETRWLSILPELNVRTYVTLEGKPGLYFISLDADHPLAVAWARQFFHLPYFHARIAVKPKGQEIRYCSRRTHRGAPPAQLEVRYRPTRDPVPSQPGTLEYFLTERYCFYTVVRQRVYRCEAHHPPWSLQPAEAEFGQNTMALSHGITLPDIPPLLHFSRRVEAIFWPLRPVSR